MHDERKAFDISSLVEEDIAAQVSALKPRGVSHVSSPALRRPLPIRDQSTDGSASGYAPAMAPSTTPAGLGEAGPDYVNHPPHYTAHPSGVECITITRHMNFNKGNAMKYIWRAGDKGNEIEDLRKAAWYIADEIARLEKLRDS